MLAICCGSLLLRADPPPADNQVMRGLTGAVVVVQTKSGSSVTLEHVLLKSFGGQEFLVGNPLTAPLPGSRTWLPVSEIKQMSEYKTAGAYAARQELPRLQQEKAQLLEELAAFRPESPEHVQRKSRLEELDVKIEAIRKKADE